MKATPGTILRLAALVLVVVVLQVAGFETLHLFGVSPDLVPLLAERGIELSREQVYRLVAQPPQRLSMDTLTALCDILTCTPNDLIKVEVVNAEVRKPAAGGVAAPAVRRSTVRRPRGL